MACKRPEWPGSTKTEGYTFTAASPAGTPYLQTMTYQGKSKAGHGASNRRWLKRGLIFSLVALPFAAVIVVAVLVTTSRAALTSSDTALATVKLPLGGATVTRVSAIVGREQKDLPVKLIGDQVFPTVQVATRQPVTIEATIQRPGWNSWLAGAQEQIKLKLTTPASKLRSSYVTVKPGQAIKVRFTEPVTVFGYAHIGSKIADRSLATAKTSVAVTPTATAGTIEIAAAPRSWEIPAKQAISWFPAGTAATAVASPSPGTQITSNSKITMTFSKPVSQALSGHLPAVSPAGAGAWKTLNSHTIEFVPSGYGYGLGAQVKIALPSQVHLVGGTGDPVGTWPVPGGSTTRLQQLLASLGYLPVDFSQSGTPVADTLAAQEVAAESAPSGSYSWRYANTPSALKAQWQPGSYDELTKAAVMAFEDDNDLSADGVDGPQVWKALIAAELKHETNSFGYTFVYVHEAGSGEAETTWHNGQTVASGAVNTGTAAAGGTATGVYAVFEHLPSTTMSGTNPDGSTYVDPGIPDVSYFNGGDALHGYIRSSYGFPQSDGCVEMPYSEAADVYPYTPIGTVVDVSTS
jgi:peptidoglycan hydrolase-like protein with peptidoglycan-binding domain